MDIFVAKKKKRNDMISKKKTKENTPVQYRKPLALDMTCDHFP